MQAIILAAGMGKRLKELTQDRTKCMVQVNGVALIDRMLHQIESRHLSRIVIVVGYEGEKLMKYIAPWASGRPLSMSRTPFTTRPTTSIPWPWPRTICARTIPCCLSRI